MAGEFWLDDRQWTAIEPLLPKHQRRAKYLTQAAIDAKRQGLDDIGFRREMLLQVVPEEGQDVLLEDIHYYDEPPFDDGNHLAHGVDLAISTKESADYTAIVTGEIAWPDVGPLRLALIAGTSRGYGPDVIALAFEKGS